MRRLDRTSPWALCSRAQVDLATSSLFTEAICTRQPPVGPDMFSIRLAMLGPLSVVGVVEACWTFGGLVGPFASAAGGCVGLVAVAGGLGCSGVGALATSASGGLGAAGVGSPFAGSLGFTGTGKSFSGWLGTAPGEMRLKTSLSWLGGTRPPAFSGLMRAGVVGACTTSGSSPRPPALTSWLCAHHTTEPKLAMAATDTMTVRICPRRLLTRMRRESRGGGGIESGSCATGRGGGSSRMDTDSLGR